MGSQACGGGNEDGSFLHVSGLTYRIDTTIPSTLSADDKDVWTGGPTGKYRVHDVKIYNKETGNWDPLDLEAEYNLAGYNYTLRDLGGGFAMLQNSVNVLDYVMEDYMVLANYIQGFENGVVGATNSPLAAKYPGFTVDYGAIGGSGRIELTTPTGGNGTPSTGDSNPVAMMLAMLFCSGAAIIVTTSGKKRMMQ